MKTIKWIVLGMLILSASAWAGEWIEGVVRRVDATNGKVTIKHGEIKELKMPAMTMVFTLKNPEWIKQLKRGQKIRFQATDLGGGKMQVEALDGKAR